MKTEETAFRGKDNPKLTVVEVPRWKNPMSLEQRFVLLGSCFAQNIGAKFRSFGFDAICNPLGVTYNPESIAIQIRQALTGEGELPVFRSREGWRCWWAASIIKADDEETCRTLANHTFTQLGEALLQADFLFITLGTNVCYCLRESGMTVANCHKMPDAVFEERRMDVEACVKTLAGTLELLRETCPKLRVVFTVSPYRYRKYGFHGSQLSKATLLLAVDKLCRMFPDTVSYFPAYELLLDELRDYRFYAEDMIHPSDEAVDHIWQRMLENCMDDEMQKKILKQKTLY